MWKRWQPIRYQGRNTGSPEHRMAAEYRGIAILERAGRTLRAFTLLPGGAVLILGNRRSAKQP